MTTTIRLATRADDGPALVALLENAFPGEFQGRTFFKQQPHARLLAFQGDVLVGQVGLDIRAITVGGQLVEICGIIDLCVDPSVQRQGIGSTLLQRAEEMAEGREFMVLMADDDLLYPKNGYHRISPAMTRFLAIDELRSHSVIERDFGHCLMVKPLTDRPWPAGAIDMLGYVF